MIIIVNVKGVSPNRPDITYCGRASHGWSGSDLGNPYYSSDEKRRDEMCEKYKVWLWGKIKNKTGVEWNAIRSLAILDAMDEAIKLGCWCAPKRCHTESIRNAIKWAQKELALDEDFILAVTTGGVLGK